MEPRIRYFLLSVIFFFYAIYLGWKKYDQDRKLIASQSWPFARVEILSKIIEEGLVRHWRVFTPKIRYSYKVDGEYISGTVSIKPTSVRNAMWLSPDSKLFFKARKTAEYRLNKMAEWLEILHDKNDS